MPDMTEENEVICAYGDCSDRAVAVVYCGRFSTTAPLCRVHADQESAACGEDVEVEDADHLNALRSHFALKHLKTNTETK